MDVRIAGTARTPSCLPTEIVLDSTLLPKKEGDCGLDTRILRLWEGEIRTICKGHSEIRDLTPDTKR